MCDDWGVHTVIDLTNENTQYQLGASLNQGHIHDDSNQSIQRQTSWIETSVDQLDTTVNQGHVCDTPISPYSDRPHEWKHITTLLGTTVNQGHCVRWVP